MHGVRMSVRLSPCPGAHDCNAEVCCGEMHPSGKNGERAIKIIFEHKLCHLMVFLCRWHLILDIRSQCQMLTMTGKFIRTSSLTICYIHPQRCCIFFFLHEIDPSVLPQEDRGSLVLIVFWFRAIGYIY